MPRDSCKCRTCGKRIYYSDGYEKRNNLQAKRLIAIRRHYKEKHPGKFKRSIARGVATRKKGRRTPGLRFDKRGRVKPWKRVKFVKRKRKKRDLLDLI